jgi:hypothetical protein
MIGNETSAKDTAALGGRTAENLPTERSHGADASARDNIRRLGCGWMDRDHRCARLNCKADWPCGGFFWNFTTGRPA